MIEIKDLLVRFQNLLLPGETKREAVRNVISNVIKIQIKKEDIEIKNNIIYLNIKPIFKNEILMKEDVIFSELKKVLGERYPDSLR